MSIDLLHERIRKLKNPSVIDFNAGADVIPPFLLEEENSATKAYGRFCRELLEGLADRVPAARFPFGTFALQGADGILQLQQLLSYAKSLGYYVLLDTPQILSPLDAEIAANALFSENSFPCDGALVSLNIGSDGLKPFLPACRALGKDLFVVIRSANKSSSELQELLTGTRHVYNASAEMIYRFGEQELCKCGYSCIAGVAGATSLQILQTLRTKHNRMFLLVDGLEYTGANFKNCSCAFDRFGYGAAICAGTSVTGAWKLAEGSRQEDYVTDAVQAVERIKKNISRYITVL